MRFYSAIMLMLVFIIGCERAATTSESVMVYESRNALQCEPTSGISPADSAAKLSDAGIDMVDTYCGYKTGVMYPAACGMGTPDILIHRIAETDLSVALQTGFSLVDELTNYEQGISYEVVDCDAT